MRLVTAAVLFVSVRAVTAWGVDRPIDATKIAVKRAASGRASLTFVTKDPAAPFPMPGSADDPSIAGMTVDLFSGSEGSASFTIPAGLGKPGWQVRPGTVGLYKFANSLAPGAVSYAKVVVLRQGKLLKVTTKEVPLPVAVAQGRMGIRITTGSQRACAMFLTPSIRKDEPGKFSAKNARAIVLPDCDDATLANPPNACGGEDTFQVIQERIFTDRGCNVGTCHGPFSAANLDLRPGASFTELIGVDADNPVAHAAGKKRVLPGDPAASFLSQKLRGDIDSQGGEGSRMPLVGGILPEDELALVDAWIAAGAPQEGEVAGAPCLPPVTYEPAPSLPLPPGGYQIVLNGPVLQPGDEEEGCMWVPVPNASNFDVGKWEFSLNPGTHHFAIFEYTGSGTPQTNVWHPNDFGCFSGANFGNNISGSPQAPYYVDAYPAGVARRLYAGRYLGLNAHYYNTFNVPIQIKVWINIHPYSGSTPKLATTIVDLDDTFSISIAPFTVAVHPPLGQPRARWSNTSAVGRNVIALGGHMHYRGLRFTVWSSGGTKLYESFDWAHPNTRSFDPPLVLPPGDYFEYECEYDNGVDRPVRTDAFGNPVNLVFGVSAEDAMCIITGSYFE